MKVRYVAKLKEPIALEDRKTIFRRFKEIGDLVVNPFVYEWSISIVYDPLKVDLSDVLERCQPPAVLDDGVWAKIKLWLRLFRDQNIRDAANAPKPPCCNKPPK